MATRKPQITLKISRNSGHTYGAGMIRNFSSTTEPLYRAEWRKLGMARDWVFKLSVTEPVKVVLLNAFLDYEVANQ